VVKQLEMTRTNATHPTYITEVTTQLINWLTKGAAKSAMMTRPWTEKNAISSAGKANHAWGASLPPSN
jgi:hypothetical protein